MKKLISIAVAVAMLFTLSLPVMSAITLRTYSTDFETESSYNWASLINTDTNGEATTNWSEVVTKAYGSDTENKALAISTSANYLAERGSFDTLAYGTVVDNPVIGNIILQFDFMPDAEGLAALGNWEMIKAVSVSMTSSTGTAEQYICNYIKYSGNRGVGVCLPDTGNTQIGLIPNDTWARVKVVYSPATGKAVYTLIKGIDTASPEVLSTTEFQLTAANTKTGVDRLKIQALQSNCKFYYDNVELYNYEATELVSSTPVSGAQDFVPMDTISLKFNNEITSMNLSIGSAPIPAASWVAGADNTYTYKPTILSWNTDYTLSGTVTDVYGGTLAVSIPFKTAPQPEKLVEIVGFYEDDNGDTILAESEKLTALEDGTITAKLRFWQTQETSYTYFMGFYRDNNGKPEMIDVVADTVTSSEVSVDKTLQLTIPTEYSDCYIRLFFLNNMSDRLVLDSSDTVGDTTLR